MLGPLLYEYDDVVTPPRRFVVFDRDQTLIHDSGYTFRPEDLRWMPHAIDLLRALYDTGVAVFIATNQSGVARGLFSIQQMVVFHHALVAEAAAQGGSIDAIAVCPHHEQGSVSPFSGHCDCRKPRPGLLRALQDRYELSWCSGVVIGDKDSDLEAAKCVGAASIDARTPRWDRRVLQWLEGAKC